MREEHNEKMKKIVQMKVWTVLAILPFCALAVVGQTTEVSGDIVERKGHDESNKLYQIAHIMMSTFSVSKYYSWVVLPSG